MSGIARKDRWSGMYGFGRMSDSKSVVGFVKDIENNPCLYDMKSHDYVNHALKRKAWMNIAKKWNCTVAECKEKWRKIRTAYSRSLKQKYRDNRLIPYRPYYLASYLKFLTPKNAIRRVEESQPQSETNDIKIEITPDEENHTSDESDNKLDTQDENPDEISEDDDCVNNEDNEFFVVNIASMDSKETNLNEERKEAKEFKEVGKVKEVKIRNNRNSERIKERCSYCANIESQPRKMLLFSLLPDIEALSDQQMRKFRRELIDLIDRCKYDVLASV